MQIINTEHSLFLEPLSEWRILDFMKLAELSKVDRYKGYESVKKLIQRLKAKNVISIYKDPWTRKSYIYLTILGEKLVSPDVASRMIDENLYHDTRVSMICYELMKWKNIINNVELEHKIKSQNSKSMFDELIPDARIIGNYNGHDFVAAIEVEITQKDKKRIIGKAKNYSESSLYDHVLYFFPNDKILNNYFKVMKECLRTDFNEKIFLFSCPEIFRGVNSLENGTGVVMNNKQTIYDVFGKFPETSQ